MAVGTVSKALLTEIANAIREQNGQQARYMPLEMGSRVLEMDGTREGVGLAAAPEAGTGILSEVVFELLADAIRTQNGSTATYTPAEMPAAIRALTWDAEVKMRAAALRRDARAELPRRPVLRRGGCGDPGGMGDPGRGLLVLERHPLAHAAQRGAAGADRLGLRGRRADQRVAPVSKPAADDRGAGGGSRRSRAR